MSMDLVEVGQHVEIEKYFETGKCSQVLFANTPIDHPLGPPMKTAL